MVPPRTALLLALSSLLMAGCSTLPKSTTPGTPVAPVSPVAPPPLPTTPATPAPAPVVELPPATITGSEETSTMLDNFTVFVAAVDGAPVAAGRAGWNAALPLPAGPRRLTLEFNRGVFAARLDVSLTAVSAAAYQVKFTSDAELFGKNTYCEFWIVNATTGEPVTPRVRASLVRRDPAK